MDYIFSKSVYGNDLFTKLTYVFPQVKLKFREKLSINNFSLNYDDLTKMVIRDNDIIPLFMVKDSKENDKVIDCLPLLCVGITECLLTGLKTNDNLLVLFEQALIDTVYNDNKVTDKDLAIFIRAISTRNMTGETEKGVPLAYSLRSGTSFCGQARANKIANLLYFLGCIKPKQFAELFFDFIFWNFRTMCMYYDDSFEVSTAFGSDSIPGSLIKDIYKNDLDFRKYTMKTPTKTTRYLTNCRGLCISVLNAYILHLVSDCYGKEVIYRDDMLKKQLEKLWGSLGNDYVDRLFRGSNFSFNTSPSNMVFISDSGYVCFRQNTNYSLNENFDIMRECFEEEFLFRKAYDVSFNSGITKNCSYKDISMHYFTYDSLLSNASLLRCLCMDKNDIYSNKEDDIRSLKEELNESKKTVSHLEKRISYLSDEYSKNCELLKSENENILKDLQHQLEQKNQIIENLYKKNSILTNKVSSIYDEQDLVDEGIEVTEKDSEEMLELLKDFSFLIVGGREGFDNKINERGWKGITQISNTNNAVLCNDSFTRPNFDFIIIITKFVSHQVVRTVESKYPDMNDRTIYFNGTNIDLLIKVVNDFVESYMS